MSGLAPENGDHSFELGSGRTHRVSVRGVPETVALTGPWTLSLGGGAPLELKHLGSWADLPEGRAFSGWGAYATPFDLPAFGADIEWAVDLGAVHETAEVSLNGQPLGAAWKGRRRLACGTAARSGRNRLEVAVANLWIHHIAAQTRAGPSGRGRNLRHPLGPLRRSEAGEPASRRVARPGATRAVEASDAADLTWGSDLSSMLARLGAGGTHAEG